MQYRASSCSSGFSALQRAEIAEISIFVAPVEYNFSFSALQRAEIAEIAPIPPLPTRSACFSALQRAEIAEILKITEKLFRRIKFQCSSTSRNC